jgi:hypothetical protein
MEARSVSLFVQHSRWNTSFQTHSYHSQCETFYTEHAVPSFHLTNPFSFNLHFTSFQLLRNDGGGGRLRPFVSTRLSVKKSVSGPCRRHLNTLYHRFLNRSVFRDSHCVSRSFQRRPIARHCCRSRSSSSAVHGV